MSSAMSSSAAAAPVASRVSAPASRTALSMLARTERSSLSSLPQRPLVFSTGCRGLDAVLRGGVPVQGLTEICGQAGAGKTQLCMQLLLSVQLPVAEGGLDGGAIYLCCEGMFPVTRLQELARCYAGGGRCPDQNQNQNQNQHQNGPASSAAPPGLSRVLVEQIEDCEHLWDVLTVTVPLELRRGRVKLVIIDSIAAVCRGEFSNSIQGLTDRADVLLSLAAYMKRLSERYGCAFVVVNQVSAVFERGTRAATSMAKSFLPNGQEPHPSHVTSSPDTALAVLGALDVMNVPPPKVRPALGISWSTCVNTRLLLTRGEQGENVDGHLRRREMRVLLSSRLACGGRCHYTVTKGGVRMVDDEVAELDANGLLSTRAAAATAKQQAL